MGQHSQYRDLSSILNADAVIKYLDALANEQLDKGCDTIVLLKRLYHVNVT
jgi:hypothetical protein